MNRLMRFVGAFVTMFLLYDYSSLGICRQDGRFPVLGGRLVKLKGSVANVKMVLGRGPGHFTLKTQEGQEFSIRQLGR